jgi:hypothetical protein
VTERAKLSHALVVVLTVGAGPACGPAADEVMARPNYDPQSRRLVRLDVDRNRNARVDQRTYLDANVPYRTEVDENEDGRVDRWEYLGANAAQVAVGTSSRGDGVEDTWTWAVDAGGERRVDFSRTRDRAIDRREFYRTETLVRAEEDTNRDGLVDKWETYDNGALREVALDTTRRTGRADRRLHYISGRFDYIEADEDGDGTWQRLASTPSGPAETKK